MTLNESLKNLGLAGVPTLSVLKSIYRKKAQASHPDRNKSPNATEEFIAVKESYEFLVKHLEQVKHNAIYTHNKQNKQTKAPDVERITISFKEMVYGVTLTLRDGVRIRVNPGVKDKTTLQVGKRIVQICVNEDAKFWRQGNDICINATINSIEAMLGIDVSITLLNGNIEKLVLPAGIQHNACITIKQLGIKCIETAKIGSLRVYAKVVTPHGLTDEQKAILVRSFNVSNSIQI